MFPTLRLCFMIAVITVLLPLEVRCQGRNVRERHIPGDIPAAVQDGGTVHQMLLRDFPRFNPSKTLYLAEVTRRPYAVDKVLSLPPGQSLLSAIIAESYEGRVSLVETVDGIAVELRATWTDVCTCVPVYLQFQQEGLQGPKIYIVDIRFTADPNPVKEGSSVNLTCAVASCHGPFHIEIIRMGDERPLAVDQGLVLSHRLDRVSFIAAGTYRCVVNGTSASELSLFVSYTPKFIELEDKHVVAKGSPVSFLVNVTAYPLPVTFSWSKDGRDMHNFPNMAIITHDGLQTTLSFVAVTEADYGLYNVTATNAMGSSSATIQLTAESAPEPPYNLKVTRKYPDGHVHLVWTAGFNGGLDTAYKVQYREMGGEWVDASEPPRNNYPNFTDIVKLPKNGRYDIRIRAANRIEPPAYSNITNVTIEDAATLYGLLPITNWDYSEDLHNLSTAVIPELDKVFNNIIGYQESGIEGTFRRAGDVMVEFHITVTESEIASAQSAFRSSIGDERLGQFNVDKDRASMGNEKPKETGKDLSVATLWLYRVQTGIHFAIITVVSLFQIHCRNPKWVKISHYLGPAFCAIIMLVSIPFGSIEDRTYLGVFAVAVLVFYVLVGVFHYNREKEEAQEDEPDKS